MYYQISYSIMLTSNCIKHCFTFKSLQITIHDTLSENDLCLTNLHPYWLTRNDRKMKSITRDSLPEIDFNDLLNHFNRLQNV